MDKDPKLTATFKFLNGHKAIVVPLMHPSLPNNDRYRKPAGYPPGSIGEIALIEEGWTASRKLKVTTSVINPPSATFA